MSHPTASCLPHRLGIGYCPALADGRLSIPAGVDHIEAGWRAMSMEQESVLDGPSHRSLHLSRAPACEDESVQRAYLDDLVARLPARASSVGLHLCGPYRSGMGWLGVGPAYVSTPRNDERARRFFAQARRRIPVPILVENANFYDTDLGAIRRGWALANELCTQPDVGLVLDLAHLWVHARNAGVPPLTMLGFVDLEAVEVVHLSGVRQDRRGVWHDAHGEPLHDELIELLQVVLRLVERPVTVVLEHTDLAWADRPAAYLQEFDRVAVAVRNAGRRRAAVVDEERVAVGLLANVVFPPRVPELRDLLGPARFRSIVGEWAETFIAERKVAPRQIASFAESALAEAGITVVDPLSSFRGFLHDHARAVLADRGHAQHQ